MKKSSLSKALIAAFGLGVAQLANALGLGPIQVNSYYGQPLKATIRVDGIKNGELEKTIVRLAGHEAYQTRGITRMPSHEQLKFDLKKSGKGYIIQVSSLEGISDPFMNFLLTVNSGGNIITREYSVFLEPSPDISTASTQPIYTMNPSASNSKNIQIQPRSTININPDISSQAFTPENIQGNQYVVGRGDTLYSIASALKPENASVREMMRAIKRANPHAFYNGRLKANATLTIPTQVGVNVPKHDAPVADNYVARAQEKKRTSKKTKKSSANKAYRPSNQQDESPQDSEGNAEEISENSGVAPVVSLLNEEKGAKQSAKEAEGKAKAEQIAKEAEEKAKAEQATKEAEEKAKAEQAAKEAEEKAKAEQAAKEAEEKAKAEQIAKEAEGNAESEQTINEAEEAAAMEIAARAEEERLAAEAKAEEERQAAARAEEERRIAEETRRKAAQAEAERLEAERIAAEEAEKQRLIMIAGGVSIGTLFLGGLGYFLWRRKKKSEYSGEDDIEEISAAEMAALQKQFQKQGFAADDSDDEDLTHINKKRWDDKIRADKDESELIFDEMEDDEFSSASGRAQMDAEALFEEFEQGKLDLTDLNFDEEPPKPRMSSSSDDEIFGDMDFGTPATSNNSEDEDIFGDLDFDAPEESAKSEDDDIFGDVTFDTPSTSAKSDDELFTDIDFSDATTETSVSVDDIDLFTEEHTSNSSDSPAFDTSLESEPHEDIFDFSSSDTDEFNLDKAAEEISAKASELEISLTHQSEKNDLDFSFDESESTEEVTDAPVSVQRVVSKSDEEAMDINLDLARTLIAMGNNHEKASKLLQDVLNMGTEEQQATARQLLERLG